MKEQLPNSMYTLHSEIKVTNVEIDQTHEIDQNQFYDNDCVVVSEFVFMEVNIND